MWITDQLKRLVLINIKKEKQTTFNTDGLDELVEDGEIENVYDQDQQAKSQ